MSEEARNAKAAGEAEVGALRTKLQHLGARRQNKQPTPAGFPQITPNNAGAAQARDLSIESNQKSVEDAEIEVRDLQLKIADKSTPPQNRKVFEESLGIAQRKLQGAKDSLQASQAARREVPVPQQTPFTNAKGWLLHTDAKGNRAYVSPDGKQFEEVQ